MTKRYLEEIFRLRILYNDYNEGTGLDYVTKVILQEARLEKKIN